MSSEKGKQEQSTYQISVVRTSRWSSNLTTRNCSWFKTPASSSERDPVVHDGTENNNPQESCNKCSERKYRGRFRVGGRMRSNLAKFRLLRLWTTCGPRASPCCAAEESDSLLLLPQIPRSHINYSPSDREVIGEPQTRPISSPSIHVWENNEASSEKKTGEKREIAKLKLKRVASSCCLTHTKLCTNREE